MNEAQESKLQQLNDNYGVERWVEECEIVRFWTDDGDEGEIYSDGSATWCSSGSSVLEL